MADCPDLATKSELEALRQQVVDLTNRLQEIETALQQPVKLRIDATSAIKQAFGV